MSINRYAARVDANQGEIVAALRAAGCSVWISGTPVDLTVGVPGKNGNPDWTLLMEVKSKTGKLNPKPSRHTQLQKAFMLDWRGGPVCTVTDVEGALRAVGMVIA
jgi:hypothetical protein